MSDPVRTNVEALRAAFDGAFAAPVRDPRRDDVALLAIRVGLDAVALRVLEIAGLLPARLVVPVPSRRPELLGISGLRGTVLPVYSLARLLGRADGGEPARWIALAGAGDRVGLAFSELDGHVRVGRSELHAAGEAVRDHVEAVVQVDGRPRPVLSVPSLLRAITRNGTGDER